MENSMNQSAFTKEYNPADFDSSNFDLNPIQEFVETEWGRELIFTQPDTPYQGKELQIRSNQNLGLHESDRFRVLYFRDGSTTIEIEDSEGIIHEQRAHEGTGYRIQPGQRFGVRTHEQSRVVEAFMPVASTVETRRDTYDINPFVKKVEKPWGFELHLAKESDPLMTKILHIDEERRLSEQVHDVKEETYFKVEGNGIVVWDDRNLNSVVTELEWEQGFRTHVGQKHRLGGKEGGVDILEISTPEAGITFRTADDYSRPNETPEQRKLERGEI